METSNDNNHGFFVMFDLLFPLNLQNAHNDFPLAAEKMTNDSQSLTTYQQEIIPKPEKSKKLTETLFDKKNYVCHYSRIESQES